MANFKLLGGHFFFFHLYQVKKNALNFYSIELHSECFVCDAFKVKCCLWHDENKYKKHMKKEGGRRSERETLNRNLILLYHDCFCLCIIKTLCVCVSLQFWHTHPTDNKLLNRKVCQFSTNWKSFRDPFYAICFNADTQCTICNFHFIFTKRKHIIKIKLRKNTFFELFCDSISKIYPYEMKSNEWVNFQVNLNTHTHTHKWLASTLQAKNKPRKLYSN